MKNTSKLSLAAIAASLTLVGCGGGGSSAGTQLVSGNLFNTYVEGATYECSSGLTGTTDKMGTYTCNVGDTVDFFLGKFPIGSAAAAEGILDTDLLSADDTADTDLLQLLQGIDDESDGVITIPKDFTALDEITVPLGDSSFEAVIAADTNITLVDEKTAVDNHAENLIQVYLGGKTVYTAAQDQYIEQWVFDANLSEANVTGIEGANTDISIIFEPIKLENGGVTITGLGHLTLTEQTEDFLLFTYNTDQTIKFYLNEVAAKAVFGGYIVITEEKLSGKTFYSYEVDEQANEEIYAKTTFSNGTVTRTEVLNGGTPETFNVPYTIIDGKIRADIPAMDEDPSEYGWITLLEETADSWVILDQGDNNQDGSIDFEQETTLYLTKPDTYPDFTATSTTTGTTDTTGTTTGTTDTTGTTTGTTDTTGTTTGTTDTTGTTTGTTDTTGTTTGTTDTTGTTTSTTDTTGTTTGTTTTTDTATKDFLAGKTFYWSDAEGRESLTFSADMTTATLRQVGLTGSQDFPITISGDTLTVSGSMLMRVDMNSLTTDTITVYSNDNPTGQEVPETWYLNQEDRLRSLLANNTWGNSTGFSVTFNADVTSMTMVEAGQSFNGTVTLNGMTLTHPDGTDLVTIANDTTLIFNPGTIGEETFTLQ